MSFLGDWKYGTLNLPDFGLAVAEYRVALAKSGKRIAAAWLSSSWDHLPKPDQIRFQIIVHDEFPGSREVDNYGTLSSTQVIDDKGVVSGCEGRLCSAGNSSTTPKSMNGAIVTDNKVRYAVTSINKKLMLVKV